MRLTYDGGGVNEMHTAWFDDFPRIPKRPSPPGAPSFSEVLPTSLRVTWVWSGDNAGSGIDGYLLRYWPNAEGSGPYIDHSFQNNNSRLVTGLIPGQQYRFRVYAHNGAADNSGYSNPSEDRVVRMLSGARVKYNNEYRYAVPFVKDAGAYKITMPFVKDLGVYKRTS